MPLDRDAGDECLAVFSDVDFAAWYQSGGVQNPIHPFRHGLDLSSAFAIPGPWSQPNKISNYSTSAMQLRKLDGTVVVELGSNEITLTAPTINLNATTAININGAGNTKVEGRTFLTHEHSGVSSGSSDTGPVV